MAYEFAGYEVEFPFGPAPGAISGLNEEVFVSQIRDSLRSPVGAVWAGTFTQNRNEGNGRYGRIFYHKYSTGETVNSMGFGNIGSKAALKLWPGMSRMAKNQGKVLIPSVGNLPNEDPATVLPQLVYDFFDAGAQAVEVDVSCNNHITKAGGRAPMLGHDADKLHYVRSEILRKIGPGQMYLEKLPAYEGAKRALVPQIVGGLLEMAGIRYISIPNSLEEAQLYDEDGNPALDVPGNLGGLSGPATTDVGREHLQLFRKLLPQHIGIVSCDGVMDGAEVYHRVHDLKADFTAGVTVYLTNEEKGLSYGQTGVIMAQQFADRLAA